MDRAVGHVAVGIVGDGLAVVGGEAVVVVVGGGEGGVLPAALDQGGAESGFDLAGGVVLEGEI